MHSPRPYGLHFHGRLSEEDKLAINRFAKVFTNLKDSGRAESLKKRYPLPSGKTATIIGAAGIFKVVVSGVDSATIIEQQEEQPVKIPLLFSGAIKKSVVRQIDDETNLPEGVEITLTEQARLRIANYRLNGEEKTLKQIKVRRFAIDYDDGFKYFEPPIKGIFRFTQYHRLMPTWYSGAMKEVVQIIAGYGSQGIDSDAPEDHLESGTLFIPAGVQKKIKEEISAKPWHVPFEGKPEQEGKIKYDYKSNNTDAIAFGIDGSPWLINVSTRGVYAMPLPVIPVTATLAFRNYMEGVGDTEIVSILDRFGGMPTGELMPTGQEFDAWVKAGVIIKLAETSDFYQHSPYYEACGWSFNSMGTEAFNTCWNTDASGLKIGYSYKLKLRIGFVTRTVNELNSLTSEQLNAVSEYILSLKVKLMSYPPSIYDAIMYKFETLGMDEIHRNMGQSLEYWLNLEMDSIATFSASLARTSEGPLYAPSATVGGVKVPVIDAPKFPALTGEGCASFDMVSENYDGPPVKSDTIMFGAYINDSLKVIRYFYDDTAFPLNKEISNYDKYMYVGKWKKEVLSGSSKIHGKYYTSDNDDRQASPPNLFTEEVEARDLGYSTPSWSTPPLLYMWGSMGRARYYVQEITQTTVTNYTVATATMVPNLTRDGLLYAFRKSSSSEKVRRYNQRGSVADSSYGLWTYDAIFHFIGSAGVGKPSPNNGTPVYLNEYSPPSDQSGFVDGGDWYQVGDYMNVTSIVGPYTDRESKTNNYSGGVHIEGQVPIIKTYDITETETNKASGKLVVSAHKTVAAEAHNKVPNSWFWDISPVNAGGSLAYFNIDTCSISFGSASYMSISEKNGYGKRIGWGKSTLANYETAQYFIGVINE